MEEWFAPPLNDLHSPLSVERCTERIGRSSAKRGLFIPAAASSAEVVARIKGNTARLRKNRWLTPHFDLALYAKLQRRGNGTLVQCEAKIPTIHKVSAVLGFLVALPVILLLSSFVIATLTQTAPNPFWLMFGIALPVLYVCAGVLLFFRVRQRAAREMPELLNYLRETLDASDAETRYAV